MKLIIACTLLLMSAAAEAATSRLGDCMGQASKAEDPTSRDHGRMQCLKAFSDKLDTVSCAKATRGFEYSTNAERMKSFCTFELKKDPRASDCLTVARSMDYGSNRDDLVWSCLRRLNRRISKKDCTNLVDAMVFPAQKARASSYCATEILAAHR